ncbi:hypothetical protein GCM10010984_30530 [Chishuiella changwenlii]|uniref:Beta-lactamase-inhibitor-like, PepSY-like n=1 Tax=Chishuiella changwenlii TaxID=1434701 RepID=A0ABQ1U7X4_9FLAO|nr:hypothetical protein [Chishuiella changwenlii]GGF11383.1 hypothetical protein GCM10010984_30530 [Chishuiella changwenlii]
MKNIFFYIILLSLTSCSVKHIDSYQSNVDSKIVYILPESVQNLIIQKTDSINKPFYLLLDTQNNNFRIYIDFTKDNGVTKWINKTNRYTYINTECFPIIFKSDEIFSTPDETNEVIKKLDNKNYDINSVYIRRYDVFHIDFNKKGVIFYSGY